MTVKLPILRLLMEKFKPNTSINSFSPRRLNITPAQYDNIHNAIYGSDEFRMYAYKIRRCTRTRSHDWTECPYAHRGEKATRRDPRKVYYAAIACPAFRNGKCHRGDTCEFAHGVFEYWLHPARYRTRACNAGRFCQRKVCFFAHTPDQLRSEKKYPCPFVYRARMDGRDGMSGFGSGGDQGATSTPAPVRMDGRSCYEGVSELLISSLRNLKVRVDFDDEDEEDGKISGGIDGSEDVLPHLDWISELVK
ncbi:zinc finger CCCH domain-containing protein 54 isoform X2 [Ricinus communis]|uniref:zinc finger CCCH domain-containing protein 54 isoform X2 n=1 Tax=Ricinus communis TaxID=3988 RepID=UPI000772A513|nr:zinc finger CCCH domain-containing protein 54 isoform X2 [Ricinus communis]|eukprot:XP_015582391.1 zinc finger CCCH domain-containing protein 54 isoform X2 [Ricinus communis]